MLLYFLFLFSLFTAPCLCVRIVFVSYFCFDAGFIIVLLSLRVHKPLLHCTFVINYCYYHYQHYHQ